MATAIAPDCHLVSRARTRGHSPARPASASESYASASSTPLAAASARPLIARLPSSSQKRSVESPVGANPSTHISMSMIAAAPTTSGLRPIWSPSAPSGSSQSTIETAQATFSSAYCSIVNPRSTNRIASTG